MNTGSKAKRYSCKFIELAELAGKPPTGKARDRGGRKEKSYGCYRHFRQTVAVVTTVLALLLGGVLTGLAEAVYAASGTPPLTIIEHDRWMGQLFEQNPAALDQPLANFILGGTHDSGAYNLTDILACEDCSLDMVGAIHRACSEISQVQANDCRDVIEANAIVLAQRWGNAQHDTIRGQLDKGVRYLDLRFYRATPVDVARTLGALQAGKFYTYHALTGPDSTVVLNDIVVV